MRRSLFFIPLVFGSLVLNGCGGRGIQIHFDNTPTAPAPTEVAFATPTTAATATPTPVVIVVTATPPPVAPPTDTPDPTKVGGHVRSTPTPAPIPTLNPAIIWLEDNFNSNQNNWWEGQIPYDNLGEITGQIMNGKYRLSLKASQAYFDRLMLPDFSGKDYYISIKAKVVEFTGSSSGDASIGLILRQNKEEDAFYAMEFWNNGDCTLQVLHNNEWTYLGEFKGNNTFRLVPGVENTFAILMNGSTFTVYANGQNLGMVNDTTLEQIGGVGFSLNLQQSGQSITVEFDDLVITEPNP